MSQPPQGNFPPNARPPMNFQAPPPGSMPFRPPPTGQQMPPQGFSPTSGGPPPMNRPPPSGGSFPSPTGGSFPPPTGNFPPPSGQGFAPPPSGQGFPPSRPMGPPPTGQGFAPPPSGQGFAPPSGGSFPPPGQQRPPQSMTPPGGMSPMSGTPPPRPLTSQMTPAFGQVPNVMGSSPRPAMMTTASTGTPIASPPQSAPQTPQERQPEPLTSAGQAQDQHASQNSQKRRMYPEEITKAYQTPAPAPQSFAPQSFAPQQNTGYQPGYGQQPSQMQPTPQPQMQPGYAPNISAQMGNMSLNPNAPPASYNLINPLNLNEVDWAPVPNIPVEWRATPSPYSNSPPQWKACSLNIFPQTQALLNKTKLPLGLVIAPFRVQTEEDKIPVINGAIIRCRRCRTYINPFITFVDQGARWRCVMCDAVNEVPNDFDYDISSNQRIDRLQRPELNYGVVEFIAPAEYTTRPPPPPVYLFIIDVSYPAIASGMVATAIRAMKESLDNIPNNDKRTKFGIITVDTALHFYNLDPQLNQAQMMVVTDLEEPFLPLPDDLLANLAESRTVIDNLLDRLPEIFKNTQISGNALGPALLSAQKMVSAYGGKVCILQASLPTMGPGALTKREDPAAMGTAKENELLQPANNFYKNFAVDCSRSQIGVDIFLFNGQYADIATLDSLPHFTGGSLFYYPGFTAARPEDAFKFSSEFTRHLAHPFGLEAVLRVRATKGIRMSAFHGNFFVRSTDLLALPNVNPDNAYAVQVAIDENLTSNLACFQTALLYTTSYGERRIRVLTLAVPVSSDISAVFRGINSPAMANLLSKMAVERALTAKLEDARDALTNKVMEIIGVYRSTFGSSSNSGPFLVPESLKPLPLMILALVKSDALRGGAKILTDPRSYLMSVIRSLPLDLSNVVMIPRLYALHALSSEDGRPGPKGVVKMPQLCRLSSEVLDRQGAFLLDTGLALYLSVGSGAPAGLVQQLFNVPSVDRIPTGKVALPILENSYSQQVNNIIGKIRETRPNYPHLFVVREDSDPLLRMQFIAHLFEDRTEVEKSYQQFVMFLKEKTSS